MKVLPRRRGAVLVNSALGVALLGGVALVYATVNGSGGTAAAKPAARTATVAKGTVLATVSGTGTLVSPTDAAQDFTTGGRLTAVKVAVGDAVRKGQVLATVDTMAAQQQVDAARSALTTANANLTKAQAGVTTTTTEPLPGATTAPQGGSGGGRGAGGSSTPAPQTTTVTTTKVDDAAVAQAQQQVATAQTALSNAQAALAGTTLTASVDGTVASISAKVGDTVGATSSGTSTSAKSTGTSAASSSPGGFIVLTNPTGMQVTANFSELDSLKLKKGEAATVTLNAQSDTKLNATVLSVSSLPSSSGSGAAGSSAVQYAATLQLTGDTSTLRTGLSATVQVVTGEADNALSLPTSALSGTGSSRTATVVHEGGATERVDVGVGVEGDTTVQVVSGLKEGDKVELPTTSGNNGFPNGSFPGFGGGSGGRGGNGGAVGIPGGAGGGGGGRGGKG
ncbi:Membrane fusion protein biotin-lipoyl like domain-containing protein OS=Kitasatospora aureofaciens OX=1894 GN=HS99_0031905 PE=4 SV=1 [Kitasatospora aureofaciens]